MNVSNILDEIIRDIDPDEVPVDYIILARATDMHGNERIIRGSSEIQDFLTTRYDDEHIMDARIVLNVKKMKQVVLDEINRIYSLVNH